jgi:hypothetical protein
LLISIFPAYLESGVAVTNLFQCFCIATIDRLTVLAGIRSGLLCGPPRESARRRRATHVRRTCAESEPRGACRGLR